MKNPTYKKLQQILKQQEKARKTFEKNTNKVAKEIIKNNEKNDPKDGKP